MIAPISCCETLEVRREEKRLQRIILWFLAAVAAYFAIMIIASFC